MSRTVAAVRPRPHPLRWVLFATPALTVFLSLVWSHAKRFWVDELLEYFSDAKPTLRDVLWGQLHAPFSLEPPLFHFLGHGVLQLFPGHPEFGSRLPSLLALLVTEFCVYAVVRRAGRPQAVALLAMSLPLLFVTADYAVEFRVYSVLAALFALALLCWQGVLLSTGRPRTLYLFALAAVLSLAGLMHYYAIFLPLPLLATEVLRLFRQRRADLPMLAALLVPFAFFLLNRPAMQALHEVQAHYYNTGETAWRNLPFTYLWLVFGFFVYDEHIVNTPNKYISTTLCVLFVVWLISQRQRLIRDDPGRAQPWLTVAIVLSLLLPAINFLAARFVTHAYVPRYGLPAVPALAILIALLLPDRVSDRVCGLALAAVFSLSVARTAWWVHVQRDITREQVAALRDTSSVNTVLAGLDDRHIYFQNDARFLVLWFYAPPRLHQQLVGVYSADRELKWMGRTPASVFARNMGRTTPVPFIPYEALAAQGGPHLLVLTHNSLEEWLGEEIGQGGVTSRPAGKGLGGDLDVLRF